MESKILFKLNLNFSKVASCLLLLCILDAFFTDIGIRKHLIAEANPLMNFIYENSIFTFYSLKIALPIVLVSILKRIQPTMLTKILIISVTGLYSVILFMHIFWIMIVIS